MRGTEKDEVLRREYKGRKEVWFGLTHKPRPVDWVRRGWESHRVRRSPHAFLPLVLHFSPDYIHPPQEQNLST